MATLDITAARVLGRPGHQPATMDSILGIDHGLIRHVSRLPDGRQASGPRLLAMPALANAHDHGRGLHSCAFGVADAPLEFWISRLGAEPPLDPYLRAAPAFARMAESGICAANHCHNTQDGRALLREAEGVSRAAADVGIRVAFAVPFAGRNPLVYGDATSVLNQIDPADRAVLTSRRGRTLEENLALVEEIAALEHSCFSVQYGPVGPQWVEDAALEAIARASADTGRRVHMHLFETERQRAWADAQYPGGLIARLDRVGLLSNRLTVAHAVWLTPDEAGLLAERGVTVSLNPSSNLRLRSGVAPASMFHRAGLGFGIGLDGMSLDDDDDMLREIRLLRHLANIAIPGQLDEAIPVSALFDAALRTGRRTIVGDDGGGTLAPGAPADVLLLDLDTMLRDVITPDPDLVMLLLTRMCRRHVRQLVVGGRTVVEHGSCVTVDRPALEAELHEQALHRSLHAPNNLAALNAREQAIAAFYASQQHVLPQTNKADAKKHHGGRSEQ
jgi:cytosine/adenosine deaminase-related metal-dependent hydrolase